MKRIHVPQRSAKSSDLAFAGFYDEISHDWQRKAEQLRIRRWRALKHEAKEKQQATGQYNSLSELQKRERSFDKFLDKQAWL